MGRKINKPLTSSTTMLTLYVIISALKYTGLRVSWVEKHCMTASPSLLPTRLPCIGDSENHHPPVVPILRSSGHSPLSLHPPLRLISAASKYTRPKLTCMSQVSPHPKCACDKAYKSPIFYNERRSYIGLLVLALYDPFPTLITASYIPITYN